MGKSVRNRLVSSLVAASIAVSGLMVATPSAQAQGFFSQCSDVHIVSVRGTGQSSDFHSTNSGTDFQSNFANEIIKNLPGRVTAYQVPYPAAAGALHSAIPNSLSATTYGESRLRGVARGLQHIEAMSKSCPNTAYVMYGFSQGADVAGDITALLAHGAIKTVPRDKILAAILVADPGRSGKSNYNGPRKDSKYWVPHPRGVQYEKNGEMTMVRAGDRNVGMTGQRSLDFAGIEGRVISLCADGDLACSTAPGENNPVRRVADFSDKNIHPNWGYTFGYTLLWSLLSDVKSSFQLFGGVMTGGGISRFIGSIVNPITKVIDALERNLNGKPGERYGVLPKATIENAITELREIVKVLKSPQMYGGLVTEMQMLAHIGSIAGDDIVNAVPPQLSQYKGDVRNFINGLKNVNLTMLPTTTMRTSAVIKSVQEFPKHHGDYFATNRINYDGNNLNYWASQAVTEGIRNYLGNRPMTMHASAPAGAPIEQAEANRLPDGLHEILRDGYEKFLISPLNIPDDVREEMRKANEKPKIPEKDSSGVAISGGKDGKVKRKEVEVTEQSKPKEESAKKEGSKKSTSTTSTPKNTEINVSIKDKADHIYVNNGAKSQVATRSNVTPVPDDPRNEGINDTLRAIRGEDSSSEMEDTEKLLRGISSNALVDEKESDEDATEKMLRGSGNAASKLEAVRKATDEISEEEYAKLQEAGSKTVSLGSNTTTTYSATATPTTSKSSSNSKGAAATATKKSEGTKKESVDPKDKSNAGPKVDTGGQVDTSLIARIVSWFKR